MSAKRTKVPVHLLRDPGHLVALGFGSGMATRAPGTFGTLAAIPLVVLTHQAGLAAYSLICVLVIVVAIWTAGRTAKALGVHDHGAIVVDEFAGLFVSMLAVPMNLATLTLAVVCFRILDIAKPGPIGYLDRHLDGGAGIVIDDVAAGLVTALLLHGLIFVFPSLAGISTMS